LRFQQCSFYIPHLCAAGRSYSPISRPNDSPCLAALQPEKISNLHEMQKDNTGLDKLILRNIFSLKRTKQSWPDLRQRIWSRRLAPETCRVSGSLKAAKPDLFRAVFQPEKGRSSRAFLYLKFTILDRRISFDFKSLQTFKR
jgi:hypothetical protein